MQMQTEVGSQCDMGIGEERARGRGRPTHTHTQPQPCYMHLAHSRFPYRSPCAVCLSVHILWQMTKFA